MRTVIAIILATAGVALIAVAFAANRPRLAQRPAETEIAPATVRRIDGDPASVSLALSQFGFPIGADRVYLVSEEAAATAPTVGSLRDGPVLIVPSCGPAPEEAAAEIARLDPGTVTAVGDGVQLCDDLAEELAGSRHLSRLAPKQQAAAASAPAATTTGDDATPAVDDATPDGATPAAATDASADADAMVAMALAVTRVRHPDGGAPEVFVVAAGDSEAALASASLLGPTLVVAEGRDPAAVPQTVRDEVARLGAREVVAVGDRTGLSDAVLDAVAGGRATGRVGGPTGTAMAVADRRLGHDGEAGDHPTDTLFLVGAASRAVRVAAAAIDRGPVLPVPPSCTADVAGQRAVAHRFGPRYVIALTTPDVLCDDQLTNVAQAAAITGGTGPTRILSPAELRALTDVTATSITFDRPPPSLDGVEVGTIVMTAEPIAIAPDGLHRRVTAVQRDAAMLVVETVDVTTWESEPAAG